MLLSKMAIVFAKSQSKKFLNNVFLVPNLNPFLFTWNFLHAFHMHFDIFEAADLKCDQGFLNFKP